MRAVCHVGFAGTLLATLLYAQDTGSVVGTVINSVSGAGVPEMNVLLWAKGAQYQATTDDSGTFRIEQIAPGSYRSRYDKQGFIPLQPDRNPIAVTASPDPVRVRVEMSPYAKLRGRVVDSEGNPAASVAVAIRSFQSNYSQHTTRTEDDGTFLFDGLTAGVFFLLATPAPASGQIALVPTYFPSAEEPAEAEKIMVRAGLESAGYEIHLRARRVYRLSGAVVDQAGKPVPRAEISLVSTVEGMSAPPGSSDSGVLIFGTLKRETEIGVIAGDDGTFQFPAVRPGPWRLVASHQRRTGGDEKAAAEGGAVAVTIADHDVFDLQIPVAPLVTLEGTAEFKGDPPRGATRAGGLMLMTADGQGSVLAVSQPDGTLRVPHLIPGAYRFFSLPGPTFLFSPVSVLLGDREVLGQVVEITEPAPPLRVLYRANPGSVRGTVEKGACEVIVLVANPAVPPFASRSHDCKAGEPFEIAGVPPGDYYALAFDRLDRTALRDPAYLLPLLPTAVRVSVGQGPAPFIQLPITHLP
jgi:hypothetical protein